MNWKTEAAEKLRRYDAMCRATRNLPLELERLERECRGLAEGMRFGVGGSRNVRSNEDRMINNMMTRKELAWRLEQARYWTDQVKNALSALTPEEEMILRQLYISPQGGGVDGLCRQLALEKSSIYRHRDKALSKFTLSLYGAQESN